MKHIDRMKLVKNAIDSVKSQMIKAFKANKQIELYDLYLSLGALNRCLEIEADLAANNADKKVIK